MNVVVAGNIAQSLVNFRGPMLKEMVDRGHSVVAVGPESDSHFAKKLNDLGVRYRVVPLKRASMNPFYDLRYLLALRSLLMEEEADVFLGYTIKPATYGNLAARFAGVPTRSALITGLGYAFGVGNVKQLLVGKLIGLLYRLSLKGVKVVFFQNPDDKEEFLSRGYVREVNARVVSGSGVDLSHFEPSEVPPPPPVFLLIARLIREKGVGLFVDAARTLKPRYPEARFQLLGPFDDNPTAISRSEVEYWEKEGVVEYLGETADVRPYLEAASVFVLPSYYREGTPRTALEALAIGRAIVTTDTPGCRETVIPDENGFLIQPRTTAPLVEGMERFCIDPQLAVTMGARSLKLATERYDVRIINAAILESLGL